MRRRIFFSAFALLLSVVGIALFSSKGKIAKRYNYAAIIEASELTASKQNEDLNPEDIDRFYDSFSPSESPIRTFLFKVKRKLGLIPRGSDPSTGRYPQVILIKNNASDNLLIGSIMNGNFSSEYNSFFGKKVNYGKLLAKNSILLVNPICHGANYRDKSLLASTSMSKSPQSNHRGLDCWNSLMAANRFDQAVLAESRIISQLIRLDTFKRVCVTGVSRTTYWNMAIINQLLKISQPSKLTGIFMAPVIDPINLHEVTSKNASSLTDPYNSKTMVQFSEIAVFSNEKDPRVGEEPLFNLERRYPGILSIYLTPGSGHSPNREDARIGDFIGKHCS